LITVERQAMDMDFRQLQDVFAMIHLMRRLIAGHRECYGWPSHYHRKKYRKH
jgi:hypothetical protein